MPGTLGRSTRSTATRRAWPSPPVTTGAWSASPGTASLPAVSDVFGALPHDVQPDVVTFPPPAVSQTVSDAPDLVRNVCVGAPLPAKSFAQSAERDALAPGGGTHAIASNTADCAPSSSTRWTTGSARASTTSTTGRTAC